TLSALEEVPALALRVVAASGAAVALSFATGSTERAASAAAPRLLVPAVLMVIAGRALAYAAVRFLRRRGRLVARAVVIGGGSVAADLLDRLRRHPELG